MQKTVYTVLLLTTLLSCAAGSRMWERVEQMSQEELSIESSSNLCIAFSFKWSEKARAELNRRGEITETDWEVIERAGLQEGMSELAVTCSLGKPVAINNNEETVVYDYGNCGLAKFVYWLFIINGGHRYSLN